MKTKYGWTLAGKLSEDDNFMGQKMGYYRISVNLSKISVLETKLKKLFNRDEEVENESRYSYEEEYAVNLFRKTVKQLSDGQYVVHPLFKKDSVKLKNSYFLAFTRFTPSENLSNHILITSASTMMN